MSPSDVMSFAVNFEVVFQPFLGLLKTYAAPVPPLPATAPITALLPEMAADHPNKSPVCPPEDLGRRGSYHKHGHHNGCDGREPAGSQFPHCNSPGERFE
jgi:hypothetical protein